MDDFVRCPQCDDDLPGSDWSQHLSKHGWVRVEEYSRVVDKFDACRAALARRYKADTGEEPNPPDGVWHEWLIEQSDKHAREGHGAGVRRSA